MEFKCSEILVGVINWLKILSDTVIIRYSFRFLDENRALASKPDDPSSVTGTHFKVGGEN